MGKISVVINTLNEEKNIEKAIKSIQGFADEILICDMYSDDNTAVIAKKMGAKILFHKRTGYVEPARNFLISKAQGEWIFILDADEEVPESLISKLKEVSQKESVVTFVEIPRKNIIFGKWMKASMWWPDHNIRFFKKGSVEWNFKIHSKPKTHGQGLTLPAEERWAIVHNNYRSIFQYINRMNRYTDIEAKALQAQGYNFSWTDLLTKPLGEFLSRFFVSRGFEDGVHGLALSMLQAFSFLVVYLKVWEEKGFKEQEISLRELSGTLKDSNSQINYWMKQSNLSKNPIKRLLQKAKNRLS